MHMHAHAISPHHLHAGSYSPDAAWLPRSEDHLCPVEERRVWEVGIFRMSGSIPSRSEKQSSDVFSTSDMI